MIKNISYDLTFNVELLFQPKCDFIYDLNFNVKINQSIKTKHIS